MVRILYQIRAERLEIGCSRRCYGVSTSEGPISTRIPPGVRFFSRIRHRSAECSQHVRFERFLAHCPEADHGL